MTALDRDPPRARASGAGSRPARSPARCGPGRSWIWPRSKRSARTDTVSKVATPYGEYLAQAKTLVDILAMFKRKWTSNCTPTWRTAVRCLAGGLKAKAKQRQWIDD